MSVDYFRMTVNGRGIIVYCSPFAMPPETVALVYEEPIVEKVSRETMAAAPKNLKDVEGLINYHENIQSWKVGSLHLAPEDFLVLQGNLYDNLFVL